ncbi:MAG: hypothetical protein R6W76_02220 [Caldilinea sp.]
MGSELFILGFARLVLDAIEATQIDYMIGGSLALYAWGDVRTTRDFDLVVHLPGQKIKRLSQELETRGMLVPSEILLDLLIQPEGDLPSQTRSRQTLESIGKVVGGVIFHDRHQSGRRQGPEH